VELELKAFPRARRVEWSLDGRRLGEMEVAADGAASRCHSARLEPGPAVLTLACDGRPAVASDVLRNGDAVSSPWPWGAGDSTTASCLMPAPGPPVAAGDVPARMRRLDRLRADRHPPVVQISLDLVDLDEARGDGAHCRRGREWTGWRRGRRCSSRRAPGVQALRAAFPRHPIVADLKTMDGGYLEAEMMARAGATHVVVMGRAHVETIKAVVEGGPRPRSQGHGRRPRLRGQARGLPDDGGPGGGLHRPSHRASTRGTAPPPPAAGASARSTSWTRWCGRAHPGAGRGRLTVEEAISMPRRGAPLVVLGAPLTVKADAFHVREGDLKGLLSEITRRIRA
jgi:3-hexulose-6-phosphate synthase/6-phospho-3-hexuloisomerase